MMHPWNQMILLLQPLKQHHACWRRVDPAHSFWIWNIRAALLSHSPLTWSRVGSARCGRSGEFGFIYPDDILRFGGPISWMTMLLVHQVVAAEPQPPMKGMRMMKTTISICKWAIKTRYRWHFVGSVEDRKYYEILCQFIPSTKYRYGTYVGCCGILDNCQMTGCWNTYVNECKCCTDLHCNLELAGHHSVWHTRVLEMDKSSEKSVDQWQLVIWPIMWNKVNQIL
jgi:hypothetical protein